MGFIEKEYTIAYDGKITTRQMDQLRSFSVETVGYKLIPLVTDEKEIEYSIKKGHIGLLSNSFSPRVQIEVMDLETSTEYIIRMYLQKLIKNALVIFSILLILFQVVFVSEYVIDNLEIDDLFIPVVFMGILWGVTVLFFHISCKYYYEVFKKHIESIMDS